MGSRLYVLSPPCWKRSDRACLRVTVSPQPSVPRSSLPRPLPCLVLRRFSTMPSRVPLGPLTLLALVCVSHWANGAAAASGASSASPFGLPSTLSDLDNLEQEGPLVDAAVTSGTTADAASDFLTADDSDAVFAYGDEMLVKMTVNFARVEAKATRLKRVTVTDARTGAAHVLMEDFALTAKGLANHLEHTHVNDAKDTTSFALRTLVAGAPAEDPVFLPSQAQYVIDSVASVDYSVVEGKGGLRGAVRSEWERVDVLASTRITLRAATAENTCPYDHGTYPSACLRVPCTHTPFSFPLPLLLSALHPCIVYFSGISPRMKHNHTRSAVHLQCSKAFTGSPVEIRHHNTRPSFVLAKLVSPRMHGLRPAW